MCKKATSCLLALLMVCTLALPALADEKDYATTVNYTGDAKERYTLNVPAKLNPGDSGNVELSGTWSSDHTVHVTADAKVTMSANIGGSKELTITFPGISLAGSNTAEVSETKQVSVEGMTALFGTWTGVFNYNVDSSEFGTSSAPNEDEDEAETVEEFSLSAANLAAIGYTAETTELTIPATFKGDGNNGTTAGVTYKITSIADGAFKNNKSLKSVTISDGITSIGSYAFSSCSALENITIPESVTSIGDRVFKTCSSLTSITLPSTLTSIGTMAFMSCEKLESVVIPDSVTIIDENAFAYCFALSSVTLSSNLKTIGELAFTGTTSLLTIDLPSSVESIGLYAFGHCAITTINIHKAKGSIPDTNGDNWGADGATINWLGED